MTVLHDAMTAYLSGLATKKNDKEIWWVDKYGEKITVELVNADLETHIIRYYCEDGSLQRDKFGFVKSYFKLLNS